jgi:hypothetical protein
LGAVQPEEQAATEAIKQEINQEIGENE